MFNQRSDLGAVLDPIADKLLLTAAYLSLGSLRTSRLAGGGVISRDVLIVTGIAVLTSAEFISHPAQPDQQMDYGLPDCHGGRHPA